MEKKIAPTSLYSSSKMPLQDLKEFSLFVNSFKDSYSLGGLTKFLEIKASKG